MALTQEQKDTRKENLKQFLSPDSVQGYIQAAIGMGTSIADTVRQQKIEKEKAKAAIKDIRAGGSGNLGSTTDSQPYTPTPPSDDSNTILGMSKPIFIGGVVALVAIAGVGIYIATRGNAPIAPAK